MNETADRTPTNRAPANLTLTFVRLKLRLLRNGSRRTRNTPWAKVGFYLSLVNSAVAAVAGFVLAVMLRGEFDAVERHRILVLGIAMVVFGWWFGPLISGGVDETIDPARLVLLPLTRSQIRRGQIAAGYVGQAPSVVLVWMLGLIVGLSTSLVSLALVSLCVVVVLLASLAGSRALATSLARLSRTRQGGDFAALVAVVGGAATFAAFQLVRFVDSSVLDRAAGIVRWSPPGMVGEALEFASLGQIVPTLWRCAVLAAVFVVCAWWWSRQLDRLLVEPSRIAGARREIGSTGGLAIFSGVRRFLPQTADGAVVARELIYLVRSPGRRAALMAGTILGLVYIGLFGVQGYGSSPSAVLFAPVAMLFSLQFASNQLGVDPGCFWLEVATGPPPAARWWGRQMLGVLAAAVPVVIAAVALAVWTGGWLQFGVVMVCLVGAMMSLVGVGSLLSPMWVTPVPDSGNPFGNKQAMSGAGCSTAILGMIYIALIGVLLIPTELALDWSVQHASWWLTALIAAGILAVNFAVWRLATRTARGLLPGQEQAVLARLDARLNA